MGGQHGGSGFPYCRYLVFDTAHAKYPNPQPPPIKIPQHPMGNPSPRHLKNQILHLPRNNRQIVSPPNSILRFPSSVVCLPNNDNKESLTPKTSVDNISFKAIIRPCMN